MATFRTSQWCQDGEENSKCYEWRCQGGAFKDALENLNARKSTSRTPPTGILSKISAWYLHENSPSKDKTFKVHINPCKVIRLLESGKFCLWNPNSTVEFVLVELEIQDLRIRNSAQEIRNPSYTGKESEIQYLESRIHSVESRIQDCLVFPYIMWPKNHNELYWQQRANNKIDHGKFTVPNTCTRNLQLKTRHLRYTNELLCRQQRTNSLFMGISDEIEVATVAILTKRRS